MDNMAYSRKPLSSLPGEYGGGSFSKEAYWYVDWLQSNGYTHWEPFFVPRELPGCPSVAYAGDTNCIDLTALIQDGILSKEECDYMYREEAEDVLEALPWKTCRDILLTMAYERSEPANNPACRKFVQENQWWLDEYAMLITLRSEDDMPGCWNWIQNLPPRDSHIWEVYQKEMQFEMEYQMYLQFLFFQQFEKLKAYAKKQSITIVWNLAKKTSEKV